MERRNLGAGLMVLASSLLLVVGTASAHSASPQTTSSATSCVLHTQASFVNQGEFSLAGTVADIAEVECNPEVFIPGTKVEISDAQLYSRCPGGIEWVVPNEFGAAAGAGLRVEPNSRSITVGLDGVGNATVALVAGPHCAAGDTVISGHTEGAVVESFSASFAVLTAGPTTPGVTVLPAEQVEDEGSSSVATILEAEFPGSTEAKVRLAAPELYSRCEVGNKVSWVRENKEVVTSAKELVGGTALEPTGTEAVRTDDDGNAFAIAVGNESCQPGKSFFEADLEETPFTTEEPEFTIKAPQPTPPF